MLNLINYVVMATMSAIGVALLLNVWRLLRGPDATDRILALDTLYINAASWIRQLNYETREKREKAR